MELSHFFTLIQRRCVGIAWQVVSISAFEAHSGSTSHHPSDNIYLENGKNLRDILSAGQESADCGDNILRALKHAIGEIQGFAKKETSCMKCGKHEGGSLISCKGPKCTAVYHAGTLDFHALVLLFKLKKLRKALGRV